MSTRRAHLARPAFTLIEVSLAMVLSAMVLAGCLGVFLALRNAENAFSARFQRTSELDIAHTVFTRALLGLQMKESSGSSVVRSGATTAVAQTQEEDYERPRMILGTDPSVAPDSTGWTPQRFELVCATPPVPAGLASQAAEWYTAQSKQDSLDYSALDGSQGVTRGVFELRPRGERERIMLNLGLIAPTDPMLRGVDLDRPQFSDQSVPPDWTLWWRPILAAEDQQLTDGYAPLADTQGDEESIRARLAGAVPLVHRVQRCIWELFKEDEFIDTHEGAEMDDLPAYAQFEIILTNQQYASWMFEIDWVLGDDPLTIASGGSGAGTTGDGSGDNASDNTNGNPGNGNGGPNTRPGNGQGGTRIDLSGGS